MQVASGRKVGSTGSPTFIANTQTELEGPPVVPLSFRPLGGQLLAADENNGQIHAIGYDPNHTVTYDVFDWSVAESVVVIPSALCAFCSSGAFFQSIENFNAIYQYPPSDYVFRSEDIFCGRLSRQKRVEGASLRMTDRSHIVAPDHSFFCVGHAARAMAAAAVRFSTPSLLRMCSTCLQIVPVHALRITPIS